MCPIFLEKQGLPVYGCPVWPGGCITGFYSGFQTVIAHLYTLSVQAHFYLDDSLLKEFDSEILSRHTCLFIRLLLDLGFLISWKKSQILPSQDFLFLGEHYRTDLGLMFPPEEQFQSL
jgi:hypothetical protein